jgi:hypothetical protein
VGGIIEIFPDRYADARHTQGRVHIDLDPDGMTIRVPAGENRVDIRGDNIEPFTFNVNVPRMGTTSINFGGLTLRAGTITVLTNTANATLHIGDRWYPVNEELLLDFGVYELRLEAPGHAVHERQIEIVEGHQEISINLSNLVQTAAVTISTSPQDVRVYLDGEFRGLTPLFLELEVRRYSLSLQRTGFIGTTTNIWITEDGPNTFTYLLANDPAWPVFN